MISSSILHLYSVQLNPESFGQFIFWPRFKSFQQTSLRAEVYDEHTHEEDPKACESDGHNEIGWPYWVVSHVIF